MVPTKSFSSAGEIIPKQSNAIARVCDSQRFIMGPEVSALEHELSRMLNVDHAIAVSSGTDAVLVVSLVADKDADGVLRELARLGRRLVASTSSSPRDGSRPKRSCAEANRDSR